MADITYQVASYVTVFMVITSFALYALYITFRANRRRQTELKVEEFITARGSQNRWYVAWSFFAGAMGSWVVVGPASYASYAGLLGLFAYAVCSGLPFLIIGYFGEQITKQLPGVLSFTHFIEYRFGRFGQGLMTLVILFCMSVSLLAEYVTLGSLFSDYVGSVSWAIIAVQGLLTLSYTAYGGLKVSIITDRAQGIGAILLVVILAIFLAVRFRYDLPMPLSNDQLGLQLYGYSSLVSMPVSLTAGTICSEAFWQRVWASESKSALRFGTKVATCVMIVVVFFFGFGGFLAVWAGLVDFETTNPNLYWFALFESSADGTISTWTGIITLVCAAVMSESALDSFQNGINGTLTATFLKNKPVLWSRICVVIVNVPLMILASLGIVDNVLSLFLVSNLMVSCVGIPVCSGLITGPMRKYITELSLIVGCVTGMLSVTLYSMSEKEWRFREGLVHGWYGNKYDWHYFAIAPTTSLGGLLLGSGMDLALQQLGWRKRSIPGQPDDVLGESMQSQVCTYGIHDEGRVRQAELPAKYSP